LHVFFVYENLEANTVSPEEDPAISCFVVVHAITYDMGHIVEVAYCRHVIKLDGGSNQSRFESSYHNCSCCCLGLGSTARCFSRFRRRSPVGCSLKCGPAFCPAGLHLDWRNMRRSLAVLLYQYSCTLVLLRMLMKKSKSPGRWHLVIVAVMYKTCSSTTYPHASLSCARF
jgi:hypothetical protein